MESDHGGDEGADAPKGGCIRGGGSDGSKKRASWGGAKGRGGDLEIQLEAGGQRVVQLGMKTRMVQFALLAQKYLLCAKLEMLTQQQVVVETEAMEGEGTGKNSALT